MPVPALIAGRSHGARRRSAFRRPPRLRTIEDAGERHASALELFFDLVFVVAVAALGETLSRHPTSAGLLHFAVLFVPVWWAWVGYTFYADRFDTDDLLLRLAMLAAMLAVAWLAVEIPGVFESPGGAARFAAAYAAVRLVLIGLYVRADYHEPRARPLTRRYIAGFTAGAALWLASAWVMPPARYVLWAIGIAVELTPPLLSSAAFRRVPFHVSHIPERFAAFTIIALGETVLLVATGMGSGHLAAQGAASAVFGFVLAACLWWVYFDFADATPLARRPLAPQAYAYGHLLVFAGITATGAGALLAIRAGGNPLGPTRRWALCGGGAAFLSAIAAIQLVNVGRWDDRRIWSRLTTAALRRAGRRWRPDRGIRADHLRRDAAHRSCSGRRRSPRSDTTRARWGGAHRGRSRAGTAGGLGPADGQRVTTAHGGLAAAVPAAAAQQLEHPFVSLNDFSRVRR